MPVLQLFRRGARDQRRVPTEIDLVDGDAPALELPGDESLGLARIASVHEYLVALDGRRIASTNAIDLFGADRAALRVLSERALESLRAESSDPPAPLLELFDEVVVELGAPAPTAEIGAPWLPLRATDADRRLVRAVEDRNTVLVDAPRGAATTVAVANLLTHLLATGRRVLVTGPTPQVLEAFGRAVPSAFDGLFAVGLGDPDGAGARERWAAMRAERAADPFWTDEARVEGRVAALRDQLVAGRREIARLAAEHERVRAIEAARHDLGFGGYRGTLTVIAQRLEAEEPTLGWLRDRPVAPCPLSAEEAAELVGILRATAPLTLLRAAQEVPDSAEIPTPRRLADLVAAERDAGMARAASEQLAGSRYSVALAATTGPDRDDVVTTAETLRVRRDRVLRGREPWLAGAVGDVLDGRDDDWRERRRVTRSVLDRVPADLDRLDALRVEGTETIDPDALGTQIQTLLEHLRAGGSMRRWRLFKPAPVKATQDLLRQVRVESQPPSTIDRLELLTAFLDVDDRLSRAEHRWGGRLTPLVDPGDGPAFAARRARLAEAGSMLERVLSLESARNQARAACVAVPGLPAPRWSADQDLAELLHCARVAEEDARCTECAAELHRSEGVLAEVAAGVDAAPACADAADALRRRDVPAYTKAIEAIGRVRDDARAVARTADLLGRLREHAPSTAAAITRDPLAAEWPARFERLHEAWDHARAAAWLERLPARPDPAEVARRLDQLDELAAALAAQLAWRRALRAASPSDAVSIGAGDAPPGWIVPLAAVATATLGCAQPFDVVIVDEADRLGPEALSLLWHGARVVVVAGDRRIRHDDGNIPAAVVAEYRERYLAEVPTRAGLDPDGTFFDLLAACHQDVLRLPDPPVPDPPAVAWSAEPEREPDPEPHAEPDLGPDLEPGWPAAPEVESASGPDPEPLVEAEIPAEFPAEPSIVTDEAPAVEAIEAVEVVRAPVVEVVEVEPAIVVVPAPEQPAPVARPGAPPLDAEPVPDPGVAVRLAGMVGSAWRAFFGVLGSLADVPGAFRRGLRR